MHGESEKTCVYGRGGVCMDEVREDGVYGRVECAWTRRGGWCIWKGLSVRALGEGGCVYGSIVNVFYSS